MALRRIWKQKQDTIRANNRTIQEIIDIYFDILDPVLFDKNRRNLKSVSVSGLGRGVGKIHSHRLDQRFAVFRRKLDQVC